MSEVVETAGWNKRVELAKKIAAAIARLMNGSHPGVLLMPDDLKAAIGDLCTLLPELTRLSHARFDMHPYDFPELVRQVEELRAFKRHLIKSGIGTEAPSDG